MRASATHFSSTSLRPLGVAGGGVELAGLAQLGIDPRFERGAAFGGGYIDIAIGDAHRNGFLTGLRGGESRGSHDGESDSGGE